MLFEKKHQTRSGKLFVWCLIAHTVMLLVDVPIWVLLVNPKPENIVLVKVLSFFSDALLCVLIFLYAYCLTEYTHERKAISYRYTHIMTALWENGWSFGEETEKNRASAKTAAIISAVIARLLVIGIGVTVYRTKMGYGLPFLPADPEPDSQIAYEISADGRRGLTITDNTVAQTSGYLKFRLVRKKRGCFRKPVDRNRPWWYNELSGSAGGHG